MKKNIVSSLKEAIKMKGYNSLKFELLLEKVYRSFKVEQHIIGKNYVFSLDGEKVSIPCEVVKATITEW